LNDAVGDSTEDVLLNLRKKPLMIDSLPKLKLKKRNRSLGLSAQQKKKLGLYVIPKHTQKYEKFVPLNNLWMDYMKKLLSLNRFSNVNINSVENKILKADYHGAFFKVTKSKCSTYVGSSGIVAKETKNMFYLVTKDDKLIGIPKYNSLFEFQVEGYVFEIFGSNFRFRPGERSARKFKPKLFMTF